MYVFMYKSKATRAIGFVTHTNLRNAYPTQERATLGHRDPPPPPPHIYNERSPDNYGTEETERTTAHVLFFSFSHSYVYLPVRRWTFKTKSQGRLANRRRVCTLRVIRRDSAMYITYWREN